MPATADRKKPLPAAVAALALAAALGLQVLAPAAAETLTSVLIDPASPDIELSGGIVGTVATASLNAILSDEESTADSVLATLDDSLIGLTETVAAGGTLSFAMDRNFISGVGTANDTISAIGLLPGPGPGGINGAGILNMQVSDTTALSVVLDGDETVLDIAGLVSGAGDASGSFSRNSVFAFGAFNEALGTIETVSYPDLAVPTAIAFFDRSDPTMPNQTASLSVMSVQQAYAFDSTPVTDQPNVSLLEGAVSFTRNTPAGADTLVDGSYLIGENNLSADAFGNRSDNSVLLRREITYTDDQGTPLDPSDDTEETLAGSLNFEGTAVASNLQTSGDAVAATPDLADPGNGVGIDSLAENNTLQVLFYQGVQFSFVDGALVADGLSLSVIDNAIAARTALNASRNQVFFDGGISLNGVLQDPTTDVIVIDDGAPERTQADWQVNNVQIAGTVDDPQLHQAASATADDNSMLVSVEDVDDASVILVERNSIAAQASGNAALNLVGNGNDQSTPSIDGVAASASTQFVFEPEVEATLNETGLTVNIGVGLGDAIGGFEGSQLSLTGNQQFAAATGNSLRSEIVFRAQSLTHEIDDGATLNTGALIFSQDGTVLPVLDYTVSAGASTLSYQVLGGDAPAFELDDLSFLATAEGGIVANIGVAPGGDPTDGLSGSIALSGNAVLASARGNEFAGLTLLEGGSFSGTAASLAVQRNQAQSAGAAVGGVVVLNAGFALDSGPLAISHDGNAVQALATLNLAETVVGFAGGAFLGGAAGSGDNVAVRGSDNAIDFNVPLRSSIEASAALLAVSDQVSVEGDVLAQIEDAGFFAALNAESGAVLENLVLSVDGNSALAQARVNDASNTILLGAIEGAPETLTATTAAAGALAGIVSRQVNTHDAAGDPPPLNPDFALDALNGAGGAAVAELYNGQAGVFLEATENGTVQIVGNRMIAEAGANSVRNAIAVDAQTATQVAPPAAGTALTIAPSAALDVDLTIEDAGFFIANSQRNEAVVPAGSGDPTAPDALGPAVVARAGALDLGNTILAFVDLASGAVALNQNVIGGIGTANGASNVITIEVQSGVVNAGVLSNQVNSGDVLVTNEESALLFAYNGGSGVTLAMDRNRLVAEAAGNAVRNEIGVTGNSFSGLPTAATGASISPGAGSLNAAPATADGNLVILNAQTTYGIGGDDPADVTEVSARLDGTVPDIGLPLGNIVLYVLGDLTNATVSLSGNAVTASAVVNGASNEVTAQSTVGGLPSATILNQQQASGTSASASVANVTITAQLGDATLGTAVSNSSVSMSGNQVGGSATINDARNTVGSPGQVFTRSSSF